ncbi:hypothetical protein AMELA_G00158980 [Ameiurus melas]|uniref:Uncharacterized protein n=1 Tax=Ameiurus melas TaxID=219545 RepID=A0A7J6AID2_AMEME|nr:hypothetical protein AMELA_G00158980 [Ameiurus melas]
MLISIGSQSTILSWFLNTASMLAKQDPEEDCAPLPSTLLANIQSLENKLDDFRARVKFQMEIWDCNVLYFTETWLNPELSDYTIQLAEFFSGFRTVSQGEVECV